MCGSDVSTSLLPLPLLLLLPLHVTHTVHKTTDAQHAPQRRNPTRAAVVAVEKCDI